MYHIYHTLQYPYIVSHVILSNLSVIIDAGYIDCKSSNCNGDTLNCIDNEDCFIDCGPTFTSESANDEACQDAVFNCPSNGKCTVVCNDREGCDRATFNAQDSASLNVTCFDHLESCRDTNIYCPETINPTEPTCFIFGDNSNYDG